jgi:formylglycine-generating enzyme required for sulfatase activity
MRMSAMRVIVGLAALLFAVGAAAQDVKPGDAFRDCPECPEVVVVPAGLFVMGLNGKFPRELPQRVVKVSKPFAIGRYEVTFDEWKACHDAGACANWPDDHGWGRGRRPVVNITFDDIQTYVGWLSEKTGHRYRLPSEAEWEYVDRAGTSTEFWWGNKVGTNKANCKDCGSEWSAKGSGPVGSFEPNPFGLYDTTGNVWEWVQDCWNPDHKGAPKEASPRLTGDCRQRVMRGGSWYYFSKNSRSAWRSKNNTNVKSYGIGFRVVRELDGKGG